MEEIYPFAVAKIRAKESRLLTKSNLENLASEPSMDRIVSVLRERGYDFDIVKRYEDYGVVLKKAEEDLYALVKEIIDEHNIVEIFVCKVDCYNIKLILKSKIEGKDYKDGLVDGGMLSKEKISSIMDNEKYEELDNMTKNAIVEAKQLYEKTKMPFIIDAVIDKACFYKMKILADQLENKFISKYIEKLIDITNIKTFFRVRKIYKNPEIFEASYIEGGKITLLNFMENIKVDDEYLRDKFLGFSKTMEQAIYNYENLDMFCDNFIMDYMKEAKLKALTIEPILAYVYAKRTEFKNIRIIFTGKLNNMSLEKIKERLRESYV